LLKIVGNDGTIESVIKMATELLTFTEIVPMVVRLHPVVEMTG